LCHFRLCRGNRFSSREIRGAEGSRSHFLKNQLFRCIDDRVDPRSAARRCTCPGLSHNLLLHLGSTAAQGRRCLALHAHHHDRPA
ncbi:hypothetical protein OESDEN_08118, partial [Oesophagostomum dentatum]